MSKHYFTSRILYSVHWSLLKIGESFDDSWCFCRTNENNDMNTEMCRGAFKCRRPCIIDGEISFQWRKLYSEAQWLSRHISVSKTIFVSDFTLSHPRRFNSKSFGSKQSACWKCEREHARQTFRDRMSLVETRRKSLPYMETSFENVSNKSLFALSNQVIKLWCWWFRLQVFLN